MLTARRVIRFGNGQSYATKHVDIPLRIAFDAMLPCGGRATATGETLGETGGRSTSRSSPAHPKIRNP